MLRVYTKSTGFRLPTLKLFGQARVPATSSGASVPPDSTRPT
jgi:hypothetical protein